MTYMFKNLTQPKEMLDSMTNETLIFLPRIMGLKGLIVEQGMLNVERGMEFRIQKLEFRKLTIILL